MKIVIGVDSGGSTTRALAVTLDGQKVGYAETGGGNPAHDDESRDNVRQAIRLAAKECGIENVVRIVAGIAGYDRPSDDAKFSTFTDVKGLGAPRTHVNDAEIAHFGAFEGKPGIVSIQGTGSMILAITEDGRRIKNGAFLHYAPSGAVRLGTRTIHALLANDCLPKDRTFLSKVFATWGVDTLERLRSAVMQASEMPSHRRSALLGQVARHLTRSAEEGFVFAQELCHAGANDIVEGIRLLGPLFHEEEVQVVLIGACVNSPPVRAHVESLLAVAKEKEYEVVEPAHPPVIGAVLMALHAEGIPPLRIRLES